MRKHIITLFATLFIYLIVKAQVSSPPSNPSQDVDKNWVLSRLYDANGNIITESKNFFDGNGRMLQTQTKVKYKLSSGTVVNQVFAVQPVYDALGRPLFNTMPAPINNSEFKYASDFVQNSSATTYDYKNYDSYQSGSSFIDKTTPDALGGQSTIGTLAWYYSTNNTWEPYTPTTNYPFSTSSIYKDGSGIKKTAGTGEVLKMGSGREVESYTTPVVSELDHYTNVRNKFFSSGEVGSTYTSLSFNAIQTISKDRNGKEGISIVDKSGKTLMTARPGSDLSTTSKVILSGSQYAYALTINSAPGRELVKVLRLTNVDMINVYCYNSITGEITHVYTGSGSSWNLPYQNTGTLIIESNNFFTAKYSITNDVGVTTTYDNVLPQLTKSTSVYYFKIFTNNTPVTISGGTYTLYDMAIEQPTSLINGNSLNAGYYKLVVNSGNEVLLNYSNSYTDISYYFYNQLGRLVATIAPEGVKKLLGAGINNYTARADVPFITTYEYDTQGRVVASVSPDSKRSQIVYRKDGKVRFSQNAEQAKTGRYSYTNYDKYGRPIESGEYQPDASGIQFNSDMTVNSSMKQILEDVSSTGGLTTGSQYDVVKAKYDVVDNSHGLLPTTTNPYNLRVSSTNNGNGTQLTIYTWDNPIANANAVSLMYRALPNGSWISNTGNPTSPKSWNIPVGNYEYAIQIYFNNGNPSQTVVTSEDTYNYAQDEYFLRGAVSMTEKYSSISGGTSVLVSRTWYNYNSEGRLAWSVQYLEGLGYKTTDYTYDVNGSLTKVVYQKNTAAETFVHYYEYDDNLKLSKVYTNTTDISTTRVLQATYIYYLHGPLKRVELATNLQGIDYVYTLQGQLKAINNPNKTNDPGQDSYTGSNSTFIEDAFGMSLDYYPGDYKNDRTVGYREIKSVSTSSIVSEESYAGNIKAMTWRSKKPLSVPLTDAPTTYVFNYDDKYQFTESTWGTSLNYGTASGANATFTATTFNKERIITGTGSPAYDANGNILNLYRTDPSGAVLDDFTYNYTANTNKLASISNNAPANNTTFSTYTYDDLGQLTSEVVGDANRKTKYLKYDVSGKVTGVYADAGFTVPIAEFVYNENGFRVAKKTYNSSGVLLTTTYYVQDVTGKDYAIYVKIGSTTTLEECLVYGSDKLGTFYKQTDIYAFELTDHLGNVRAVIAKNGSTFDVRMYSDYYPFGYEIQKGGTGYRDGYQGQYAEKDDETGWNAFELRMYDSRIARWLSIDPEGEFWSPYVGMGSDPINTTDPDGGSTSKTGRTEPCDGCPTKSNPSGTVLQNVTVTGAGYRKKIDLVYQNFLHGSEEELRRAKEFLKNVATKFITSKLGLKLPFSLKDDVNIEGFSAKAIMEDYLNWRDGKLTFTSVPGVGEWAGNIIYDINIVNIVDPFEESVFNVAQDSKSFNFLVRVIKKAISNKFSAQLITQSQVNEIVSTGFYDVYSNKIIDNRVLDDAAFIQQKIKAGILPSNLTHLVYFSSDFSKSLAVPIQLLGIIPIK